MGNQPDLVSILSERYRTRPLLAILLTPILPISALATLYALLLSHNREIAMAGGFSLTTTVVWLMLETKSRKGANLRDGIVVALLLSLVAPHLWMSSRLSSCKQAFCLAMADAIEQHGKYIYYQPEVELGRIDNGYVEKIYQERDALLRSHRFRMLGRWSVSSEGPEIAGVYVLSLSK